MIEDRVWADVRDASPRYRLSLREPVPEEVSIMLSQHTVNKDRPLDDIALHVFEEHQAGGSGSMTRVLHPQRAESAVSLLPVKYVTPNMR
jgi:hypothetical protein